MPRMAAPKSEVDLDVAFNMRPVQDRPLDPEVQALREVHDALVALEGMDGGDAAIKRVLTWAQARFLGDIKPGWTPQQVPATGRSDIDDRGGPLPRTRG